MGNQLLQWSMFIAPWLSLAFMTKEDIKRYMPVGLLAIVATTIIHDVGIALGFWAVREAAFSFNQMMPYFYGTIPILTMWIFKFTYGRFWLYLFINVVFDAGFAFFILNYFFPSRGIYGLVGISSLQVMVINFIHFSILYLYQMWQEGIFVKSRQTITPRSTNLQPAAAKPLAKNVDTPTNKE